MNMQAYVPGCSFLVSRELKRIDRGTSMHQQCTGSLELAGAVDSVNDPKACWARVHKIFVVNRMSSITALLPLVSTSVSTNIGAKRDHY